MHHFNVVGLILANVLNVDFVLGSLSESFVGGCYLREKGLQTGQDCGIRKFEQERDRGIEGETETENETS